jgi:hypothetical protein
MVNGIILEMMEAMTLQEFQQWAGETGWSFWAQIMTPEEARGYRNTLALELVQEGPDDGGGESSFQCDAEPHWQPRASNRACENW